MLASTRGPIDQFPDEDTRLAAPAPPGANRHPVPRPPPRPRASSRISFGTSVCQSTGGQPGSLAAHPEHHSSRGVSGADALWPHASPSPSSWWCGRNNAQHHAYVCWWLAITDVQGTGLTERTYPERDNGGVARVCPIRPWPRTASSSGQSTPLSDPDVVTRSPLGPCGPAALCAGHAGLQRAATGPGHPIGPPLPAPFPDARSAPRAPPRRHHQRADTSSRCGTPVRERSAVRARPRSRRS